MKKLIILVAVLGFFCWAFATEPAVSFGENTWAWQTEKILVVMKVKINGSDTTAVYYHYPPARIVKNKGFKLGNFLNRK